MCVGGWGIPPGMGWLGRPHVEGDMGISLQVVREGTLQMFGGETSKVIGEKWPDSEYTVKEKLIGFADGLEVK